jgi:peptidase E
MRKLFVMGGGGFAMEPENLLLDRYILSLSSKPKPKICFIGTASGDAVSYEEKFYAAYRTLPCEPSTLSLFRPHTQNIEGFIREQDIVHVGGGNTRNLLILWKEWKLDRHLRSAYEEGTVLCGMSAGMLCWFEEFTTDSYGESYVAMKGLGWLKGSAVPHFDGESERLSSYLGMLERKEIGKGIALDDGAGALFLNEELGECVSSRRNARALAAGASGENSSLEALPIRYLGRDL